MKKVIIIVSIFIFCIVCFLLITNAIFKNNIKKVHTKFLFAQIKKEHKAGMKTFFITNYTNANWTEFSSQQYDILANIIRKSETLDWNSCSLNDNIISDGWNRKCIVEKRTIPTPAIRLSSCGKDGIQGTDDDIVLKIEISKKNKKPNKVDGLDRNAVLF